MVSYLPTRESEIPMELVNDELVQSWNVLVVQNPDSIGHKLQYQFMNTCALGNKICRKITLKIELLVFHFMWKYSFSQ